MNSVRRDPTNLKKWMIDTTVTFPDGTRRHLRRRGFDTKGDAEYEYPQLLNRFLIANGFKPNKDSFNALLDQYYEWKSEFLKLSSMTVLRNMVDIHILKTFDGVSIQSVYTQLRLSKFRKYINSLDVTQSRKNKILKAFYEISDYGFTRNHISAEMYRLTKLNTEPFRGQETPPRPYVFWSIDQYRQFIQTFDKDDKYLVLFQWMFFSGSRVGETLALQWKDLDTASKRVWINKSATAKVGLGKSIVTTTKTKSGNRYVYLSDAMYNQLCELKTVFGENQDSYMFFGSSQPMGQTTVRRIFKEHTKLAGLPNMRVHEIRHTNATWLIRANQTREQEHAIKQRLGHHSISVTLGTYFHHDPEKEKEIAEIIEIE